MSACEEGTALPVVLFVAVLLATVVGALALVLLAERRLVLREVQRAQATYVAEAGAEAAVARLALDPTWRPNGERLVVGEGVPADSSVVAARVWARGQGAYVQVASRATVGHARASSVVLVGREPPEAFEAAIVLGDLEGRLVFAGDAHVEGPVVTGTRGWETGTLGRRPFRGVIRGDHRQLGESPMPEVDVATFEETLDRLAAVLDGRLSAEAETTFAPGVRVVRAPTVLRSDDLPEGDDPVLVLGGDVEVVGPFRFPSGSTLAATGRVVLGVGVTCRRCLVVGDRVEVRGAEVQGQVLARRALTVDDGARFRHPSVLYVHEPPVTEGDGMVLTDALVDGLVLTPPRSERGPPSEGERAGLVVRDGATVRGAVVAGRRAEVSGRVQGTLAAAQFFFYQSPSVYVNWIDGADVRLADRPEGFVVGVGVGRQPLVVIR